MRVAERIALSNPERIDELKHLLRELQPCWWREWVEAEPRSAGIVDSVREKSCFIRMEGGNWMLAQSRSLPEDCEPRFAGELLDSTQLRSREESVLRTGCPRSIRWLD